MDAIWTQQGDQMPELYVVRRFESWEGAERRGRTVDAAVVSATYLL
jgi:hypothetical protein